LTHIEAASLPVSTLTAWQGLFERAKLLSGERVLVHGGAGSVGLFVVQLAHRAGAHVITTASSQDFECLSHLGAAELIDYRTKDFEKVVKDVDVLFDTVGGLTLRNSWNVLKPGGRIVTIAADSEGTKDERIEKAFFLVEPNRNELIEIGRMVGAGILSHSSQPSFPSPKRPPPTPESYSRSEVAESWYALSRARRKSPIETDAIQQTLPKD
jgi:NADPH:quinone reductase-like Zn-dependent oxidoreductase